MLSRLTKSRRIFFLLIKEMANLRNVPERRTKNWRFDQKAKCCRHLRAQSGVGVTCQRGKGGATHQWGEGVTFPQWGGGGGSIFNGDLDL